MHDDELAMTLHGDSAELPASGEPIPADLHAEVGQDPPIEPIDRSEPAALPGIEDATVDAGFDAGFDAGIAPLHAAPGDSVETGPSDAGEAPPTAANDASRGEQRELAARLRAALVANEPETLAAMVTGDTVAEIEASYAAAKALAERLRAELRREAAATAAIPAGAPGRNPVRPMSARDMILAGLSSRAAPPEGSPGA